MAKSSLECKKLMVKEISGQLNNQDILIVTNFKGLSAQNLNDLRRELRNISAEYLIVKDSLAKKAVSDGPSSLISDLISGDVGIAIGTKTDPTYISKALMKFAKDNESLKICGGVLSGEKLSIDDIKNLAFLPSRDVLLGRLANVLNAPIQGMACALNGIIRKFLYALNALKEERREAKTQNPEDKLEEGSADQGKSSELKEEGPKNEKNKIQDTQNTGDKEG